MDDSNPTKLSHEYRRKPNTDPSYTNTEHIQKSLHLRNTRSIRDHETKRQRQLWFIPFADERGVCR